MSRERVTQFVQRHQSMWHLFSLCNGLFTKPLNICTATWIRSEKGFQFSPSVISILTFVFSRFQKCGIAGVPQGPLWGPLVLCQFSRNKPWPWFSLSSYLTSIKPYLIKMKKCIFTQNGYRRVPTSSMCDKWSWWIESKSPRWSISSDQVLLVFSLYCCCVFHSLTCFAHTGCHDFMTILNLW